MEPIGNERKEGTNIAPNYQSMRKLAGECPVNRHAHSGIYGSQTRIE
jgi:hypothetical protein